MPRGGIKKPPRNTPERAKELFDTCVGLAYSLAHHQWKVHSARTRHRRAGRLVEDLCQIALETLWNAALHFDETRGVKFSTYVHWAVQNAFNTICTSVKEDLPMDESAYKVRDGSEDDGNMCKYRIDPSGDYDMRELEARDEIEGILSEVSEFDEHMIRTYLNTWSVLRGGPSLRQASIATKRTKKSAEMSLLRARRVAIERRGW